MIQRFNDKNFYCMKIEKELNYAVKPQVQFMTFYELLQMIFWM